MTMIKCFTTQMIYSHLKLCKMRFSQIADQLLFGHHSTYCGRCSLGLLSSSAFPRLGFLELEAAVSEGSDSSQLSEVLATVWPQRRRPLFSTPIPPPPTLFSLPRDAAFCRSRQYMSYKSSFLEEESNLQI